LSFVNNSLLKAICLSRIFLIGFMGSGKTTLGRELAGVMQMDFKDLDEEIEKNEGTTISELFQSKGEEYFRSKESFYMRSLEQTNNVIIATGGGTPCFYDNMQWMNDHGLTVYLNLPPEILFQRLRPQVDHRPLLKGKTDEELLQFIRERLKERSSYYGQSEIIVEGNSLSASGLQKQISVHLKKKE